MNLKPERREDIDLNLTPLIDVVFLLLIFFMVSTTFEKTSKLKIDLPEASVQATQQVDKKIVIGIDMKGRYYINERQLVNTQLKTLKLALLKIAGDNKEIPIVLRADAKTPHQSVVRAMDAASQVGLTRLSISTLETSGSK
ncbi:MAG: biopolymer transporter ExbD [endosymbiont of Galathealinum brachiosum]|uniref:Biopolymer transporter ExbD n=1 Tax=endosymbiont of Galathealinum brachiosum TaxID=2200906 RepID=A0A370DHG7_9GAMM|nr:MAG: biopolymer transporter ExbD [endosymbiont of Galathealinum brachiosum]